MDRKKKRIVIALMVAMFLAAVEGTIVTIAVPTIANDLDGFEIISLLFSAYFLTSAISTPIYGKLSDLYGRKNVLTFGIIIFLVGSILCGLSKTMSMLIAFRAVQGLGAGAILTITYTIMGDVFTLQERPKVQGGLATVWGIASLAGPFLGGFLIDVLSWHWIFFINLPFGILSVVLLQNSLQETFEKKKHKIDYAGTIVFSMAMILFLNIFLSNNNLGMNHTPFVILSTLIAIILLFIFYKIEKRANEPMIPFDIFTKTSILVNIVSFMMSIILIGTSVYFPIYLQNVLGLNATISGLALAPMSVSWLISSVILGKYIEKIGGKSVILISAIMILIGTTLLTLLDVNTPLSMVILFAFILGFGYGGAFTTLTIVIQTSVSYHKRGAAMAANSLLRILGQTIGISILGGIFNFYIVKYFQQIGVNGINPSNMYASAAENVAVTNEQIRASLNHSLFYIYAIFIALSLLCVIFILLTPKITCDDSDLTI